MHAVLVKPLDWLSIRLAKSTVRVVPASHDPVEAARALLAQPDFFCDFVTAPANLQFHSEREFIFPSPLESPSAHNNCVHGKLFRCGPRWERQPAVVLLHGWNAETGYRVLFPHLARRLNQAGLNAAMIELPYHSQRKPRNGATVRNFLSSDLASVVAATRQALADVRALVAWLAAQGCPQIGLWGVSLGAWLAGLVACHDDRVRFSVLMTPVARIDRVVAEADFCEVLRRQFHGSPPELARLNLTTHRPRHSPRHTLIVAGRHDLFAPAETIEELWEAWERPDIWRMAHGHISTMMSLPVMERACQWVAERAQGQGTELDGCR